jgi:hypothetical protein
VASGTDSCRGRVAVVVPCPAAQPQTAETPAAVSSAAAARDNSCASMCAAASQQQPALGRQSPCGACGLGEGLLCSLGGGLACGFHRRDAGPAGGGITATTLDSIPRRDQHIHIYSIHTVPTDTVPRRTASGSAGAASAPTTVSSPKELCARRARLGFQLRLASRFSAGAANGC